jgi:hypothetical protein
MTSSIKNRLLCAALFASLLPFSLARAEEGTAGFTFGPPLNPVWDVTGTYDITNHMQSATIRPTDIVFKQVALSVDGHGKISGGDTIVVEVADGTLAGDCKASGKFSGGGTKTRVNLSLRFKGNGTVAGVFTSCNISVNYNLTVDPVNRALVGKGSGSANFSHLGNGNLKSAFSMPLPAGVDGGWTAVLDVIPFSKKLSGSAVITVNNDPSPIDKTPQTVLATKLTGNLKGAVYKTKLSGYGFSSGTKLNLDFTPLAGTTNQVGRINGKVLGQKVKN